ncbi:MAG: glycosyltransferase family 4 protein, partial [Rhizobiales bacterium]|nr:glycosyltransferase family 4 protein [Hyphomicrobiales bacterium]
SRTGAPITLLHLAKTLQQLDRFELRIVTRSGGPLLDAFASVAPLCSGSEICERLKIDGADFAAIIANKFAALQPRGLAICNTVTLTEYNEAFARAGIDQLTWLHELPVFYDASTMESIVRTSKYIAVYSEWNRAHYKDRYAIPEDKLVIAPPVLTHLPATITSFDERRTARKTIGVPEDALMVLGVGYVHLIKGTDLFIQIAARCLHLLSQADSRRLVFCWIGSDTDFLTSRSFLHDVAAAGLENVVFLSGEKSDPWPWYRAADVFACTSRWEALSLSVLEAMSSGLPVVTFAEVGASRFVVDGAGSVVQSRDVEEFSKEIVGYLNDFDLRAKAGGVGHHRVRLEFGDARLPQGLQAVVNKLSANESGS